MIKLFGLKKDKKNSQAEESHGFEQLDVANNDKSGEKGMKEIQLEKLTARRLEKKHSLIAQITLILGIVILIVCYIIGFHYTKYLNLNNKGTELTYEEIEFVNNFKQKQIDLATNLGSFAPYVGLPNPDEINNTNISFSALIQSNSSSNDKLIVSMKDTVNQLINNEEISYITKSDQLKVFINDIGNSSLGSSPIIRKIEADIGKYGFLPEEVHETIDDNTIQRSFLGIETIKYFTAMKTLSYLDSFKTGLGDYIGIPVTELEKYLNLYINNGEKDLEQYLSNCVLNPYEISTESESCISFLDFEKYIANTYTCKQGDKNCINVNYNTKIFKKVIEYIKIRLEAESLPILSIILNSLDPNKNTISFTIDINTYSDDEKNLLDEGILNPNVFISTNLINSLRKSHMILGSGIKIDNLKVNKKDIKNLDGTISQANNSSFIFTIPIQKSVEKEIYDYAYSR